MHRLPNAIFLPEKVQQIFYEHVSHVSMLQFVFRIPSKGEIRVNIQMQELKEQTSFIFLNWSSFHSFLAEFCKHFLKNCLVRSSSVSVASKIIEQFICRLHIFYVSTNYHPDRLWSIQCRRQRTVDVARGEENIIKFLKWMGWSWNKGYALAKQLEYYDWYMTTSHANQ